MNKLDFREKIKLTQQKRRRIDFQLQEASPHKIARLMNEKNIEKVSIVMDEKFIQPTFITVQKDNSAKNALGASELKKFLDLDRYQIPTLERLIDLVAQQLDKPESQPSLPSSSKLLVKHHQIKTRQHNVISILMRNDRRS